MCQKRVDFYFDFLSPFSYFAWKKILQYAPEKRGLIHAIPLNMGPLIKSWDTKGPAEISSKRDVLFRHLLRETHKYEIPFRSPWKLPFNSQHLSRLIIFDQMTSSPVGEALITEFFNAIWCHGKDMENFDEIIQILSELGVDAKLYISGEGLREVRTAFKANLSKALEFKLFGVPSFVYDGELFWGADSIEHLMNKIDGKDCLDQSEYQKYLDRIQIS